MDQLMEILRDPLWQFVGAVIALLGIVVGIVLQYRFRPRKALQYQIRSLPLVVYQKIVKDRIQVLLDGAPVSDAGLVTVTLTNTGNVSILPSDFVEPVTLTFDDASEVLQAEVTGSSPSNLGGTLTNDSKTVVLNPVLLNSGDYLSLSVLAKPLGAQPRIDARIVGVSRVSGLGTGVPFFGMAIALGGLVFLILFSILALALRSGHLGMLVAGFLLAGVYGYMLQQLYLRYARRTA